MVVDAFSEVFPAVIVTFGVVTCFVVVPVLPKVVDTLVVTADVLPEVVFTVEV